MGQPPSDQALKCSVMLFVDTSMNLAASGIIGLEPFVRVFSISEASPVPILSKRYSYDIKKKKRENPHLSTILVYNSVNESYPL